MSAKLTTHVLDTSTGRPAVGMKIKLYRGTHLLTETATNPDGRTDTPLIPDGQLTAAEYRIEFAVGDYFSSTQNHDARRFLNIVPVIFIVDDLTRSYHVPLLVSPWAYSTYRGS